VPSDARIKHWAMNPEWNSSLEIADWKVGKRNPQNFITFHRQAVGDPESFGFSCLTHRVRDKRSEFGVPSDPQGTGPYSMNLNSVRKAN
jgi:hypothetical protein